MDIQRNKGESKQGLVKKLSGLLNKAIMEEFHRAYGGFIKKLGDDKYSLEAGNLKIVVYLEGSNIITELERVPEESAEDALIELLKNDRLFTLGESPFLRKKPTLKRYTNQFQRQFDGCRMVYVPQKGLEQAKKSKIIDTIIDYILKPPLLLLPTLSKRINALCSSK